MKRVVVVIAVAVVATLAGVLVGCDLIPQPPPPATPLEQVEGFLLAASAEPQDPIAMKAFFDPTAAQYENMQLSDYWETTFFVVEQGTYSILGADDGDPNPDYPDSVTITGNVTNFVETDVGYSAEFIVTTYPDSPFADPLIRKITVTVVDTDEIIEKVIP